MFKVGDKVKFKKSSINSGMIDATEDDVFVVLSDHLAENSAFIKTTHDPLEWYTIKHFEHAEEEIMNNVDAVADHYVPEVGDKVKGFAFESETDDIYYVESMDAHVGELGEVVRVDADRYVVQFDSTACSWTYPISLAHLAKMDSDESSDTAVPEDNTAIDWEIGQEVWDVRYGKGIVDTLLAIPGQYPIGVVFTDGSTASYTSKGLNRCTDVYRSLFFSEPKIEAEKFPPKKLFVPAFQKGDVVAVKCADIVRILILEQETERQVKGNCGRVWDKDPDVHFYKLGEEIKFN